MKSITEDVGLRIVALLVIVALASVVTLWTLDMTSSTAQTIFAVYLAVDLVAFAMISYVYRGSKSGEIHAIPVLAGSILVLLLILAGFAAW